MGVKWSSKLSVTSQILNEIFLQEPLKKLYLWGHGRILQMSHEGGKGSKISQKRVSYYSIGPKFEANVGAQNTRSQIAHKGVRQVRQIFSAGHNR